MLDITFDREDDARLGDAKTATVVWLRYDGPSTGEVEQGDYLLIDRDKDLGRGLAALGGTIEEDDFDAPTELGEASRPYVEDALAAAARQNAYREVREETHGGEADHLELRGKVVQTDRPYGTDEAPYETYTDDPWAIYHFTATTDTVPERYEHREGTLTWVAPDDLRERGLAMAQDEFVDNILDGRPFSAVIDDAGSYRTGWDADRYLINMVDELRDWPVERPHPRRPLLFDANITGEPHGLFPRHDWPRPG